MNFPKVEILVRDFLIQTGAATVVATKVPNPRPARFVRAWRTGGAAINRVLESALITVQAWDADGDPETLAAACRHALLNDHRLMPLVRGVEEVGGLYYDPDPVSNVDRYTFTVQVQVRATRV